MLIDIKKYKCKNLIDFIIVLILVGVMGLATIVAIGIGMGISFCESLACWIVRLFERK
jgi:hypothetical protein